MNKIPKPINWEEEAEKIKEWEYLRQSLKCVVCGKKVEICVHDQHEK